jgi:hypothetical protein
MIYCFNLSDSYSETPRYLVWVDRHDEAWDVIQKIHNDPTDPSNAAAHAEFVQITQQVAFDKQLNTGYVQMFVNPSWRKRSLLAMFIM